MKYWLVVVQWMVLATAMAAPPKAPPKQAPTGNRFLFVLETSATMARLEHGGRQAVFDLIYSGVDGRMRRGDTYGIWTFNEQVFAGLYPMQIWDAKHNLEHASGAGRFLKAQKYEKEGRATNLLSQLQAVLRVAKDLNIFVITDGNTLMTGTPFDAEINAGIKQRQPAKVFVTTLVARNGQFTAATVNVAGEKIVLADLPPPATEVPAVAVRPAVTNVPPAQKPLGEVISIAEVDPDKPRVTPSTNPAPPIIVAATNSAPVTLAAEPPQKAAVTEAPAAKDETVEPPAILITPPPVSATPSNLVTVKPTNAPAVVVKAPAVTNEPVAKPEPLPAIVPAQIQASARTTGEAPTGPKSLLPANIMLLVGGVFVGASVLGGVMFMRRMRTAKHPSFISQGMDRR